MFHYPKGWKPGEEEDEVIKDIRDYYKKHPERKPISNKEYNPKEGFYDEPCPDEYTRPKSTQSKNWPILSIVFILIILLLIIIFFLSIKKHTDAEKENENYTSYEIEYTEVNFGEYLNNINNYDNKEVTISGFIYQTSEKRGADNYFVERIVDDLDNEIRLIKTDSAIGKDNIIENAFVNVTGILKKRPSKIDLEVSKIVIASRPSRLVAKTIEADKTEQIKEQSKNETRMTNTLNSLKEKASDFGSETKEFISEKTQEISKSIEQQRIEAQLKEEERYKTMCIGAFDYVNELRSENGRGQIKWDERVYKLAVARSKDMYERNYFDHVTPEGLCVNDFKGDYGLEGYTLAENAGAQYEGYSGSPMSYSSYINAKEQVDGWMRSRGHRYNLMYSRHVFGAIGCYRGACIFLGAHTDNYGLGAGPCATGEQGLAFWESAGRQPGEI